MRIRYFSDLHLEFLNIQKIKNILKHMCANANNNDVCVLAGDICNPYSEKYKLFFDHISKVFKKTFVIAGNHEYYNKIYTYEHTNNHMKSFFKKYDNVSLLDNETEKFENYTFVGTTLWSNIKKTTSEEHYTNDMFNIPNFDLDIYNQLNTKSKKFLSDTLISKEQFIIITHHVPLFKLIHQKYLIPKMEPYHQWFANDLSELIDSNSNIKCWFYGHTHMASFNKINDILFLCNPLGYPDEITHINFNKYIEL